MSDEMDEVPESAVVRHPAAQWRPDRARMRRRLARDVSSSQEHAAECGDESRDADVEPGESPHYP